MYIYYKLYNYIDDYLDVEYMATLTVSIPKDLKKRMDELPEVNWQEAIKIRLKKRAEELEKFEKMRKQGDT